MIVRIDEVGRATAVNYTGFEYRPEAPELRYFLAQFVQLHFSRMLNSVDERFGKSLFFLDAKLSQAVIEEERKTESLKAFVKEGHEEIDIEIKNVILQDLRSKPMKAAVDFEKVYYPRGERRELQRERYAASFEFEVQGTVPSNFILVNPLGLTVTYFRIDEAFKP
jgi:type IV secretory pathway component VirB8